MSRKFYLGTLTFSYYHENVLKNASVIETIWQPHIWISLELFLNVCVGYTTMYEMITWLFLVVITILINDVLTNDITTSTIIIEI